MQQTFEKNSIPDPDNIPVFNDAKAEAFVGQLVGSLSGAALALMTALGHRCGLFDALAELPPTTSDLIAEHASLSERYVREWLAVMVTSGVVEYNPVSDHYKLPAEHAAFLTRAASPNNIAVTAQFIGVAASVEDEMLKRFRSGDGMHYSHFERFHEVMMEDSTQTVVAALVDQILPIAPGLKERLEQGIKVVDIGCGGGSAMLCLAEAFPKSQFLGVDLCADAFAKAEVLADARGLDNLQFQARDLSGVISLGQFDLITAFDAIHDQKHPQNIITMVRKSLAPDGVFLMQDIGGSRHLEKNLDDPFAPLLYTISLMHCTPISIGQGGLGLGNMWGVETAKEFLTAAGFSNVRMHRLAHDPINAYFVAQA